MGIQNPQTINLNLKRNPISGLLEGGYLPINPDNSWRIASAYRLQRTDTLAMVTHLSSSGSMAAWRWASSNHKYVSRLGFRGGEPPFRVSILQGPTGATVGGTSTTQTWTRTQSSVDAALYIHSMPSNMNEIHWQPSAGDIGTTKKFRVRVESADDQVIEHTFYVTVDNSKFYYFSPTGSDSNTGLFGSPWLTFGKGASTAGGQNRIHCYFAGTYDVHNGTPVNDYSLDATHCLSHIGLESGVVFNCATGEFSQGASDIFISNVKLIAGRADKNSARQINLTSRSDRVHINKVTFDTTTVGTVGGDNPAGFFLTDIGPNHHDNVCFTDCVHTATSLSQMAVFFTPKDFLIENCVSLSPNTTGAVNGSCVINLKDGTLNGTMRLCDFAADTGGAMFLLMSQSPEDCGNVDIHYSRFVYLTSGTGAATTFNDQVSGAQLKPSNYYIQRVSIDSLAKSPFSFKNFAAGGTPVNYSAVLWESTASTIDNGTTGGQSFGTASVKVADINNVSAANLGVRGWTIASTLVT